VGQVRAACWGYHCVHLLLLQYSAVAAATAAASAAVVAVVGGGGGVVVAQSHNTPSFCRHPSLARSKLPAARPTVGGAAVFASAPTVATKVISRSAAVTSADLTDFHSPSKADTMLVRPDGKRAFHVTRQSTIEIEPLSHDYGSKTTLV